MAVADLNGDGRPDLAVADFNADTVSVLLGNGDGTFGAKTGFGAGSGPLCVAIGDLNGDGKPDLAVADFKSSSVTVLLNRGGSTWTGVPHLVAAGGALSVRARPNPLVVGGAISFNLPVRAEVSVCVYDLAGRRVATLARGTMAGGAHEVRWNRDSDAGRKVGAGVYLVELRAGTERQTTRIAVLR